MATVLIGTSSLGGNTANSNGAGTEFAQKLTCGTSGTVTTLNIRTGATTGVTAVHCALYADNAGALTGATRLSDDKTTASDYVANSVNVYVLGTPVVVTSGTVYWIAFLGIGSVFNYTDNGGAGSGTEQDTNALASLATPHPTTSTPNTNLANVWAEGTTGSPAMLGSQSIPFMPNSVI